MASSTKQHAAVQLLEFNEAEPWAALRLGTTDTPSPRPSQVLIKVLCRPINPSDVGVLQGRYALWQPPHFPAVPGFEGMGVVEEIGEGVTSVAVGQRVVPFGGNSDKTGQGLWQEYIVVPQDGLIAIPESICNEVAAQLIVNPFTVIGLLRSLNVPEGEYVLQTAAASVLGRMFIQYAHHKGVKTINVVRRDDQIEELKALGADEVINGSKSNVAETVKSITGGKMAFAAIECVGGETTKIVVESVRNDGLVLVYGLLSGSDGQVGAVDLIFRGVKVEGFHLGRWVSSLRPEDIQAVAKEAISLLAQKVMEPLVGEKFKLEDVREAVKKSLEAGRGGKVLLVSE